MTLEQQSQLLCDALALACQVHRGQLDLARQPYILHVLRVVSKCDGEELQAHSRVVAALHDVCEDGSITFTSIDATFGWEVGSAVMALTRLAGERYTDYINRVAANPIASVVKRADLIDNLRADRRPVGESDATVEARREKYRRALHQLGVHSHPMIETGD